MGIFSGWLIACDFDNTITNTHGVPVPDPYISEENAAAIRSFMAQGGIFALATGRSLPDARPAAMAVPSNAPTVIYNGAAIYDYAQERYLHTAFLPEEICEHITQAQQALGKLTFKLYYDSNSVFVVNPNEITARHQSLSQLPVVTLDSIYDAPLPILKIAFEEPIARHKDIVAFMEQQPWRDQYDVVSSTDSLLEVTVHGANKGSMVAKLAEILGIDRRHVYTMGDQANDIPMLEYANVAFAPQNATDEVKQVPGIRVLSPCWESATAEMISVLDKMY